MKSRSEVTPAGPIKVAIVSALAVIIPMIITGIICHIIFDKPHRLLNIVNEGEPKAAIMSTLEKVNNPKTDKFDY